MMAARGIDPDTLVRLVALGREPRIDDLSVVRRYESLRNEGHIDRLHRSHWNVVTQGMSVDDLVALVKGLVVAERRFHWGSGSVAASIWVFHELARRDHDLSRAIAEWAIRRTSNPVVPFGRRRSVVISDEMLDMLDSLSPGERERWFTDYRQREEARLAEQKEEKRRRLCIEAEKQDSNRAVREERKAANRRKLLDRHWAGRPCSADAPEAEEWRALIERADSLAPLQRIDFVVANPRIPLGYFPKHWADCSAQTLKALTTPSRQALLERVAVETEGAWHSLAKRLLASA